MNKIGKTKYHIQLQDTRQHFQTMSTVIFGVQPRPVSMTSGAAEQKESFLPLMICYS